MVHTFLNLGIVGRGVGVMEVILRSAGYKLEDKTDMLRIAEEHMARTWALDVIGPLTESTGTIRRESLLFKILLVVFSIIASESILSNKSMLKPFSRVVLIFFRNSW